MQCGRPFPLEDYYCRTERTYDDGARRALSERSESRARPWPANAQTSHIYRPSPMHDAWTDLMDRPHHPGVYIPSFMQPARLHECTNQRIYSYDFQSTQCNAKCTHNASTGLPVRVSLHPTHWAFWSLIVYFCHRTYFFLCFV